MVLPGIELPPGPPRSSNGSQHYCFVSLNIQRDVASLCKSLLTEDRRFVAILSHPYILLFAYLHGVSYVVKIFYRSVEQRVRAEIRTSANEVNNRHRHFMSDDRANKASTKTKG